MKNRSLSTGALVLTPTLFLGCFTFEKSYPEKRYFALGAPRPSPVSSVSFDVVLAVRPFRISPSYAGSEFVYRTGDVSFESDFYNEFFVPPSRLITEEVRRWLESSGLFKTVVDSASPIEATHILEGAVQAIYGEYGPSGPPRAALELQFFLLKGSDEGFDIVLHKNSARKVELSDDTADALVRGWNQGLQEILREFEETLRSELSAGSESGRRSE